MEITENIFFVKSGINPHLQTQHINLIYPAVISVVIPTNHMIMK